MFPQRSVKTLIWLSLWLVAGCSAGDGANSLFPSAGNQSFQIESEPGGAEVYAMGEKVGVTPLQLDRKQVFPNVYPKEKESLYGRVTLKKPGCEDFTRPVSMKIASSGLRAELNCGDAGQAASATPAQAPRAGETVEQRLEKIRDLLGKGLISEDEAKRARERILGDI